MQEGNQSCRHLPFAKTNILNHGGKEAQADTKANPFMSFPHHPCVICALFNAQITQGYYIHPDKRNSMVTQSIGWMNLEGL
jgi:hypothetical protein